MKTTITESMFRDAFARVRPNQFSRSALNALFDHYDELERDTGAETELNVIAICCDWTEYDSFAAAAAAYSVEPGDIADKTTVIETDSGILVLNY